MAHWDRNHDSVELVADGVIAGDRQDLGGWDGLDIKAFIGAIREHLNYIYDGDFKSAKISIKKKDGEVVLSKTIRS